MHTPTRSLTPLLALSTLLLALGCGKGAPSAPPAPAAGPGTGPTKLRVGYNIGSLNRELALETAFAKGIFERHGFVVEDKGYSVGGQIAQDLAAGGLDIGLVGISPSLAAIAQGADLVIVASQTKNNAPLVAKKAIHSIVDLDGKRVGTPGMSSIQETMLNYLERKHGIKTTHVYGKAPDLVGYLEKGEIDAILGWEPVAARAVESVGAHYLLDTVIPGAEASMVTVSGRLLRERRDVVLRFLRAMEETRQALLAGGPERIKVAAAKAGLTESVVTEGVRRSRLFLEDMAVNLESVRLIASEDVASGKIRGVPPGGIDAFVAKAVDAKLCAEAIGAPAGVTHPVAAAAQ